MRFYNYKKWTNTSSLLVLCLGLQLSACNGGSSGSVDLVAPPVTVGWTAASEREDGSGLSLSEIGGYRVYYGTEPGDYQEQVEIDNVTTTEIDFNNLVSTVGTYYVAITIYDTDGRESDFSQEIEVTISA